MYSETVKLYLSRGLTACVLMYVLVPQDNLAIIEEIKGLRNELKTAKQQRATVKARVKVSRPFSTSASTALIVTATPSAANTPAHVDAVIAIQRDEIGKLKVCFVLVCGPGCQILFYLDLMVCFRRKFVVLKGCSLVCTAFNGA